jgi:hypothetical protein
VRSFAKGKTVPHGIGAIMSFADRPNMRRIDLGPAAAVDEL